MKGQVALEFLTMVSISGIALLVLLGISYSLFNVKIEENDLFAVEDLGYSIQNEIILASEVHDGYEREIFIPDKIGNMRYDISNTPDYLVLNYTRGEVLFLLPDVSGSISKGNIKIKNVEGQVVIS